MRLSEVGSRPLRIVKLNSNDDPMSDSANVCRRIELVNSLIRQKQALPEVVVRLVFLYFRCSRET
jgi:hypothetical protein